MANSTSMPQPINQAVVHQIIHMRRAGQLRGIKALGLDDHLMKLLDSEKYLSMLATTSIAWCDFRVDKQIVHRLLQQVDASEEHSRLIDRALSLGASSIQITTLFGLTNEEIKHRRQVLDVPQRKGRWRGLSEEVEHALWKRWEDLASKNSVDVSDQMAVLDIAILIAEEYASQPDEDGAVISLAQIWSNITSWLD